MSFLGKLFGSDEAIAKTVDTVAGGIDKLIHTEQEREEASAKDRSEARKMLVEWMGATQGQNLSRRLISLSITFVWLSQFVVAQILSIAAVISDTPEKMVKSSEILRTGALDMSGAVMLILAFYFAAPHMSGIAQAVLSKYTDKTKHEPK